MSLCARHFHLRLHCFPQPAVYTVQAAGSGTYTAGTLAYDIQAQNSYEARTACSGSCSCSYTASLALNATTYNCYMLYGAGHYFSMQVSALSALVIYQVETCFDQHKTNEG